MSLALHHSGEEMSMTIYTISISENNVWAGNGVRDEHGAIACDAVLSAAEADSQDVVYGPIEEAVSAAITAGDERAECEVNGYQYTMLIEAEGQCECGALTGERCQWTGPLSDTESIEYMPEHLILSHVAAGYDSIAAAGVYPHNGAQRICVERSCAERLVHIWEDGDQTDRLDLWVRRVA
jgi:hypothetical protein